MKKHTRSEVDRGQTVLEIHGQQLLISIQHNAVIIAVLLASAVPGILKLKKGAKNYATTNHFAKGIFVCRNAIYRMFVDVENKKQI